MKVLVTGDNGFIGRQLAIALRKKGFDVVGLDLRHTASEHKTVDFDLTKPEMPPINDLDVIFHLAADTECIDPEKAFKINVKGTEKILDLARRNKIKSFVYVSTGGVYGFGPKPFKETDKPNPDNTYTKTKYQAELLCKKYSTYFPVTILRYFFPYDASDDNRRLVNRLANKIKNGETVELNTDGKPVINPVAMSDAINATVKSMEAASGFNIFNVGGAENVSILDLVKLIEKELKIKAKITYNNKKVENLVGDITKAKKILKFEPKVSLKNGIKDVIKKTKL